MTLLSVYYPFLIVLGHFWLVSTKDKKERKMVTRVSIVLQLPVELKRDAGLSNDYNLRVLSGVSDAKWIRLERDWREMQAEVVSVVVTAS